jgi:hypothetical protein
MTTIKFYELTEVNYKTEDQRIATAAVLQCSLCGVMIDGMGGPGHGAICQSCGESLISRKFWGGKK